MCGAPDVEHTAGGKKKKEKKIQLILNCIEIPETLSNL